MMDKVCGRGETGDIRRMYHVRNEVSLLRAIKTRIEAREDSFLATKRLLDFFRIGQKKNEYLNKMFHGKEVK